MGYGWYGVERLTAAKMRERLPEGAEKSAMVATNTMRYTLRDEKGVEWTVYRYHDTDIVKVAGPDTFILNSGGFKTATTKERMSRFMPAGYYIRQRDGIWYVEHKDWATPYYDGFAVTNKAFKPGSDDETKAVTKQINKYIKALRGVYKETGAYPMPSLGDCIPCRMDAQEMTQKAKVSNVDHLLLHISDDEMYVHGSILVAALKWAGFSEMQFQFIWHLPDHIPRAVRRYLKFQLGVPS